MRENVEVVCSLKENDAQMTKQICKERTGKEKGGDKVMGGIS